MYLYLSTSNLTTSPLNSVSWHIKALIPTQVLSVLVPGSTFRSERAASTCSIKERVILPARYHPLSVRLVLAARTLGLARPVVRYWNGTIVSHAWDAVPENVEGLRRPPTGFMIDLYLALKPHHENALIDALCEIRGPRHTNCRYGAREVTELVAPHPDALKFVNSWVERRGVPPSVSTTLGGKWVTVNSVPPPSQRYPRHVVPTLPVERHHSPHGQLTLPTPRGPERVHTNGRAHRVLRLSAYAGET